MNVARTYDEMVSPEWLTAALGERYPGIEVVNVEVSSVLHGVGTKAMLDLEYASDEAVWPQRMCAKAGWEDANAHLQRNGVYAREARFYKEIAGGLDIRTPQCHYSGVDDATGQGIVLLEDLVQSKVRFGSAARGFSVDEASKFMEALAALHARHWGATSDSFPWMRSSQGSAEGSATGSFYTDRLEGNLADSRADTLPDGIRDANRMIRAFGVLTVPTAGAPTSVVHGDCHARNLFVDADGAPGFFDFQTVHVDHWAIDVAYLLGANLDHDDRRQHLDALIEHYLSHLASHGVDAPSWDDAWDAYRRHLVYGLYLWSITRTVVQPHDVITTFVDRLGNAAAEADSYEALGV